MSQSEHYFDDQTLDLAKFMMRLSMAKNDMAVGARAAAYVTVLLSRLMVHHDKTDQIFSERLTEEEENLLDDLFSAASEKVEDKTKGQKVSAIVQQLVREANKNRRQRRHHRSVQRKNQSHNANGQLPQQRPKRQRSYHHTKH